MKKAGFWLRVAALTIDEIILVSGVSIILLLTQAVMDINIFQHIIWAVLFYELADYNYYTLFWLLGGQTPGKRMMRIKLIKSDGSKITYQDVFIRYWTWMLGVALAGVGYFWIAFHKNKQGWNDLAAGTYVVKL